MPAQDKTPGISRKKWINLYITEQMYDQLRELQQKGGFSCLSPLIRSLIKKRKLKIVEEAYCLDRVMGVLTALYDVLAFMELDLRQMASLVETPPETRFEMSRDYKGVEGDLPNYSARAANLTGTVDRICEEITPVKAFISQLSKIWLQG